MSVLGFKKAQAFSGLVFGLFLFFHLLSHVSSIFGSNVYQRVFAFARSWYHIPLIEIGIFGILAMHMFIALSLWLRSYLQNLKSQSESALSRMFRWCGWVLMVLIVVHVTGGRFLFLILGEDYHTLHNYFLLTDQMYRIIFIPYYTLLFTVGTAHFIVGTTKGLRMSGFGRFVIFERDQSLWILFGVCLVVIFLTISSISGVFYEIPEIPLSIKHHFKEAPAKLAKIFYLNELG